MNQLVANHSPIRHPLALQLLKSLAAVLVAVVSLAADAFAAGTNSVSLAWNQNPESNVAGYRLQYGTTSGAYPNVIDAGTATSATATGLNSGTTYYFAVVAYNTSGQNSAPSSEISYTVPGTPNTAPAATSFPVTVAEDGQAPATLSGTDAEGDGLSYTIVGAPSKGTLSGTAPNLTYRPNANATGSDTFTYRVSDGALNSPSATVSIAITPVNDTPVADAKSVTVSEDGQVAVTLSGSDVDGNPLTYTVVTGPSKGTLSGTGPNLTYRPAANATGSDSFTYRVNDGTVNSANATVNITINPSNDAPVATPRSLSVAEDSPLVVVLSGSDPEGSALTYTVLNPPGNGTLSGTPPNLTYTPKANFHGADSFPFRVSDGSLTSTTAWISVTVTPVNDTPVAAGRSLGTAPNTSLAVTLSGTDADSNPLTYAVVSGPSNGTLSGAPPNLTYTPANGFTGTDGFTYRVNDGTVNSANAAVTITVATVNNKPVAHGKTVSTLKGKMLAVKLSGSDPEGQALRYRVTNPPLNGTVTGTPPNLTYRPAAGWTGVDQFHYVTNDGSADSAVAQVIVRVKSGNVRPVAASQSVMVVQNTPAPITVSATDGDNDPLGYALLRKPRFGTVTVNGAVFTYTPKPGFKGKDSFTFLARDGFAKAAVGVVSITVHNPNNKAPLVVSKNVSTFPGKAVSVLMEGTDADLDRMTYRVITRPANGRFVARGASRIYTPPAGFTGTVSFTYVANDGTVDSAPATVTITVAPAATTARTLVEKSKVATGGAGAAPSLTISSAATGGMRLTVTGVPGERYTLEHSPNLTGWSDLQQVDVSETGVTEVEVVVPAGSKSGFFRLRTP